jgi:hypothetical protein
MKYRELKAKATATPWGVRNGALYVPLHSGEIAWTTTLEESNAMLARHCVNNFDKALEALKECVEEAGYPARADSIRTLIAELEEVKQ